MVQGQCRVRAVEGRGRAARDRVADLEIGAAVDLEAARAGDGVGQGQRPARGFDRARIGERRRGDGSIAAQRRARRIRQRGARPARRQRPAAERDQPVVDDRRGLRQPIAAGNAEGRPCADVEGPRIGQNLPERQRCRGAGERERSGRDRPAAQRRGAARSRQRIDVGIAVQPVEIADDGRERVGDRQLVGIGVGVGELADRRRVAGQLRHRDPDRVIVGDGDRSDVRAVEPVEAARDVGRGVGHRQLIRVRVGVGELADRRRVAGQLRHRDPDRVIVGDGDRSDVRAVEPVEAARDIGRGVGHRQLIRVRVGVGELADRRRVAGQLRHRDPDRVIVGDGDRSDVRAVEPVEAARDIGRGVGHRQLVGHRVGVGELADRRRVAGQLRHRDPDRVIVGDGDRSDVRAVEPVEAARDIGRGVGHRQLIRVRVGVGELADRRRVAGQLRHRDPDRVIVGDGDRSDVRAVEPVEAARDIGRGVGHRQLIRVRVGVGELADRRRVAGQLRHRDPDRVIVGDGDRSDVRAVEPVEAARDIGRGVGHRQLIRVRVGVGELADRRRVAGQLRHRDPDRVIVGNRDRVDVRIVELIDAARDVGRDVGNGEAARNLVVARDIGEILGDSRRVLQSILRRNDVRAAADRDRLEGEAGIGPVELQGRDRRPVLGDDQLVRPVDRRRRSP